MMLNSFLDKFTDESVKNKMKENYKEFKKQKVNFKPIEKPIKEIVANLKELRKDIVKDKNMPNPEELLEMIDNKIANLTEGLEVKKKKVVKVKTKEIVDNVSK